MLKAELFLFPNKDQVLPGKEGKYMQGEGIEDF